MKKVTYKFGFLLMGLVLLGSCKKDGCMDVKAENYDAEAEKDEGDNCTYQAELVVWFSQETKDTLNVTYPLDVWIGGASVATWNVGDALSIEPVNCETETGTAFYSEGPYEVGTASVTIWDANNVEVKSWTGYSFPGGECTKLKF
jgi:hypothetical protein